MSAADERLTDIILWHGLFAAEDQNAELELQHLRARAELAEKRLAEAAAEVARLTAEDKRLRDEALPKLSAALSRIDYLCGEPNEMEVSGYDLHCDEQLVVKAVERLTEKCARADALADAVDDESEFCDANGGCCFERSREALAAYRSEK